jgi:hypothetical protein
MMNPMVPGFNPMQFAAPKMGDQTNQMAQNVIQAALRRQGGVPQPGMQPGMQPGQPGAAPNPGQMGMLGQLLARMRPAAPDGMMTDATGFNPGGASGLY